MIIRNCKTLLEDLLKLEDTISTIETFIELNQLEIDLEEILKHTLNNRLSDM